MNLRHLFITFFNLYLSFHSLEIWGIGEWQFVISRGSSKLTPIAQVLGLGCGEFRGVFCFRFEVNLKFVFIEKIFI